MRGVIGCAVTVIVILSLLIAGISCSSKPEETAEISDLHTFMKNESYGVGDGCISGSISNTTNKVRDYEIKIERWKPAEEWKRGDPRNEIYVHGGEDYTKPQYLETVGTIKVLGVQPDEKRSWEYLLFKQRGFKYLNWEWRVCVDGWCWKYTIP